MRYICDHCGIVEDGHKPIAFASFVAHLGQTLGLCGQCKQRPDAADLAKVLRAYGVDWLRIQANSSGIA